MSLLVERRSTIFNNYYAPHQSAGKLTCAKALATCRRIHVVEWSVHQNIACSLGNFHSAIPMSRYFLHYSPRSMFKIDTIVTDYDTLWSVRKKNFTSPFWNSLGANIRNGRSSYHFGISSLYREIKMKVSLALRTKQEWRCKSRRVRTHHSTPQVAVRRLGRIIQRIFLPNQEAALVEPFGNGLVRVGSQGLFLPYL